MQRDGVPPRVAAEQGDLAPVLAQQAEQDADRGGLARAVRPEVGVHLAGAHGEVQAVKRGRLTEPLDQRVDIDGVAHTG